MRKLQIQVLTRDGRKNTYETDRFRNVGELKKRIGQTMNVPMGFSRLTYKGRLLTNDSVLEDEGIKRMSTLELYWQPMVLTPKQYREKELELDKQDQKQRHLSRIVDTYDQTVKKAVDERTPSAARRTIDQVKETSLQEKPSQEELKPEPKLKQEQEEQSSSSSDELDFLAAYWCCSKTDHTKSNKSIDYTPNIETNKTDLNADADTKNLDIICGNMLKEDNDELLDELLEQRCLGCKHQPFRTGVRLTAGRMSNSIISNIRKNQKNCKK